MRMKVLFPVHSIGGSTEVIWLGRIRNSAVIHDMYFCCPKRLGFRLVV